MRVLSYNVFWKIFIKNFFFENENKFIDIWYFCYLIKRILGVYILGLGF